MVSHNVDRITKAIIISNIVLFIESIVIILLNLIAIITMLSLKSLRKTFNDQLLLILFTSHLLAAILNIVCACVINHPIEIQSIFWYVREIAVSFEIDYTILLSFERFLAIRKPFLYSRLGKSHAVQAILNPVFAVLGYAIWRYYSLTAYYIASIITISGGFAIFISNIFLYRSIQRQCEGITKTIIDSSEQVQSKKRESLKKRKLKSLKICIYITASYLLTWFPLMITVKVTATIIL